jgi:hypothetical protein
MAICFTGFERLSVQRQLSAVESLSLNSPTSTSPAWSHTLPMEQRTAGKRRLSSGQRDDSYNGGERQRHCFGNSQQQCSRPHSLPFECRTMNGRSQTSCQPVDDSFISQYLSLGVERMDLQSDQTASGRHCLPWTSKVGDNSNATESVCVQDGSAADFAKPSVVNAVTDSIVKGPAMTSNLAPRTSSRRCRRALAVGRVSGLSRPGIISRSKKSDGTGLDSFFDRMGMDQGTLRPSAAYLASTFENVSSIGTSTVDSRTSYGESEQRMNETFLDSFDQIDINERETSSSSASVVERNARIIKWLCSIKKSSADGDTEVDEGFV